MGDFLYICFMEIWKDIIGYEGLYQISNFGRLKSIRRNKVLFRNPASNGYIIYSLWKNNNQVAHRAHRLVAEHFFVNPFNLPIVDHIDGIRHNNHIDNLRWVDHVENIDNKHDDSIHKVYGKIKYSDEEILNEIWVDATKILPELKGKDIFMVSSIGRLKVAKRGGDGKNHPSLVTVNLAPGRYPRTSVRHNGKPYHYGIHQLVARCFIGEIPEGFVVDHKDSNIHNPRLDNLQIITIQENNKRANKTDDTGCKNGMSNHTHNDVMNILKDFHINHLTEEEIKDKYNITHTVTVRRMVNGLTYKKEYELFNKEYTINSFGS